MTILSGWILMAWIILRGKGASSAGLFFYKR
jgi:hypothetical protein